MSLAGINKIDKDAATLEKSDLKCPSCDYHSSLWTKSWVVAYVAQKAMTSCPNCGSYFYPHTAIVSGVLKNTPTTQKAKGIGVLAGIHWGGGGNITVARINGLLKAAVEFTEEVKAALEGILPQFARPCPPTPEHGFVESRVVNNIEELEVVRQETLAANADSEIMLMHLVDAKRNAIWTPNLLTFGSGHDGATAGKETLSVPLCGQSILTKAQLKEAAIGDDQHPYIEAVIPKDSNVGDLYKKVTLTQLRAGPALNSISPDFIPAPTAVTQVVKTNGEDLLEWAKLVKSLVNKPGVVVWHPGGSLVDHYSVHCRENGVPIVLTFEPQVGQTIEATTELAPFDPQLVLRGLAVMNRLELKHNYGAFTRLLLITLHNSAVMRGVHSFWIGVAVGAIIKLGVAAMEAEARHAHSCFQGMKNKPDIYGYYTARTLSFLRSRLSRVTQILHYGFGDPNAPHSFGGPKWALCGAAMVPLFNGVRTLANDPSEANVSNLVLALNIAVNQAHNGGWWLNKFTYIGIYDTIPKGNAADIIAACEGYMESAEASSKLTDTAVEKFTKQVASWPDTEIKPLKWRKVSLDVMPGAFVLNLKASTVPQPKTITIPATPALVKSVLGAIGEIKIDRGRIDIIGNDGSITNVWEEVPLVAEARNVKRH